MSGPFVFRGWTYDAPRVLAVVSRRIGGSFETCEAFGLVETIANWVGKIVVNQIMPRRRALRVDTIQRPCSEERASSSATQQGGTYPTRCMG